jgi:DNA repair protein RAD50
LPPNSKGGAFIHDPKLCGEKEVLAQVKLSFKGTSGAKMVVTRSLQLTVKKTARTQKTLEGQLLMVKDGERTTISSRVAELDQIMPQYLGVSEAVLDSVIFCHQDESLWPMSEPGVLKKKFDEIFEALKYTKAIDNIKAMRKFHNAELAKQKILEEGFKLDKDKAERAEKKSLKLQDEIEALREQSEKLNHDMQEVQQAAKEKHQQKNVYFGLLTELEGKKNRAKERQDNVNDLRTDLEELHETDEWLESTNEQYAERMIAYKQQERDMDVRFEHLQKEIITCRENHSRKLAEQGQCQAEKENYERQLQLRITLVREAARRHAIRGFDGDLDDDEVRDFLDKIGKMSRERNRELERTQKATEDELKHINSILTDLEGRRSAYNQDKLSAKQTIAGNDKRIYAIQHDIDHIQIDEGAKAAIVFTHEDLKERLERSTADFDSADWDKRLQLENVELRNAEAESDRLGEELVQSTRLAGDRARLDFIKKELKDRQRSLETMVATHGDTITKAIGHPWQAATLEREFQDALDLKTQAVADAQRQRDGTNRELEQISFRLSAARESRKKKSEEMKTCEQTILCSVFDDEGRPLSSVADYPEEVAQLEKGRDLLKSDAENYGHMIAYFSKGLKTAEEKNVCHLCERPFADSKEKASAVTKLRSRLSQDAKKATEAELKHFEDDLVKAKAARPSYDAYVRLSEVEVPALEKDIAKYDEQRSKLLTQVEGQDKEVSQEESAKRSVEALSKTISNISRYNAEISGFDAEISRISSQQKSSGNSLSLEDIQEQLAEKTELARGFKTRINKLNIDKERARALINSLELELRDIASKLNTADFQLQKKEDLLSRIRELKESNEQQRNAIEQADQGLEALAPEISQAKAQYQDAQQRGRAREKEVNTDASKLTDTLNKLNLTEEAINNYIDNGGPNKLARCLREIKAIEEEMARYDDEVSGITAESSKLKEQIENSEKIKRTITDNIKFRKNLRALEVLRTEIADLESRNDAEDYDRLAHEATRLDSQHQRLLAERGPILGSMKAKDEELQRLLEEWEMDYKHAARNYREAHIKVETTKAAITDLGQYGTALDQAIMKYHSLKMEEINRIAGELWQSTYQGTDVDTIMIRSDNENAKGQRNFNYRVCMVKQDAEMDMRGRCSAGQRVLASIIIRLALAECFGVNCGVSSPSTHHKIA